MDGRHLTLLVRDQVGWRNLCRLLTRAHAHTRESPQRDRAEPAVSLDDVARHHEGLVCLSGCARSGVRDEPTMRRLSGYSVRMRSASSCSAHSLATIGR